MQNASRATGRTEVLDGSVGSRPRADTRDELAAWLAERARSAALRVERIPFGDLVGWRIDTDSGNLVHDSGRFFTVEGLSVRADRQPVGRWEQPILCQPEVGILGILTRRFNGVPHYLMQAKVEPGNINGLQVSPTVQATRSNYTKVHGGRSIPYLEYFTDRRRGRVLIDALQSEQDSWILHKRNRNMVVEIFDHVPVHPDFRWLTMDQVRHLFWQDNMVNMDSRSVLAAVPLAWSAAGRPSVGSDDYLAGLVRSATDRGGELHSAQQVVSWLMDVRAGRELVRRTLPLAGVTGWRRDEDAIRHVDDKFFSCIAVRVEANNREVDQWSQPLLAPAGQGLAAFLTKQIDGVVHVLVQARTGAGTLDIAEVAPTVHCCPLNYRDLPRSSWPTFLDYVLTVDPSRIRYDVRNSEEGGRFFHAENRYLILDVADDLPVAAPDGFIWVTVRQLTSLLRHSYYVNVEARSLIACLQALYAQP